MSRESMCLDSLLCVCVCIYNIACDRCFSFASFSPFVDGIVGVGVVVVAFIAYSLISFVCYSYFLSFSHSRFPQSGRTVMLSCFD